MKKILLLILFIKCITIYSQNRNIEYEYDQEKLNKAGQREGELIHSSYDEKTEYKHLYKEGKLIEATNYRYFVEGKKELVGRYKSGNPYEGYFVYRNEFEIPLIDYYENGIFMAQYTCSLLDLISNEGQEFNIKFTKTTYKNNKPQNGLVHKEEFRLDDAHLIASEYYKDGKVTNVDFWIMAVHYAELIKLKFLSNGYTIYKESMPNVQDEAIDNKFRSITVEFKDAKNGTVLFEVENKLITKYQFSYFDTSQKIKHSKGSISYFFLNDSILAVQNTSLETKKELYNEGYGSNSNLISRVFLMMNSQPVPYLSNEGGNDYSLFLEPDRRIDTNAVLYLDEKGNPFRGFFIEQQSPDKYKYIQYENAKIISQKEGLTIKNMKELILKEAQYSHRKF
ncbi:hypothetical protein [Flavobacterium fluviatile]|uniref:hypothetical protein n=1 Tax=Flavobacterium fluviatile TaxID=1862387 RepID=UPI0013D5C468|nr:hypothetical protein [Flavobacterium fluviatile]